MPNLLAVYPELDAVYPFSIQKHSEFQNVFDATVLYAGGTRHSALRGCVQKDPAWALSREDTRAVLGPFITGFAFN